MIGASQSALMSDKITISLNELRALLRKAFEGVFGHSRDWNAMADTVIWLECNDLGGMRFFFEAYREMRLGRKASMLQSPAGISINANGTSLLEFVHLLGDVLLAEAKDKGWAKAQVSSAKHPQVLQIAIDRIVKAGFSASYSSKGDEIVFDVSSDKLQSLNSSEHYHHVLDNGYSMARADYIKLCEYADKVLVPATEQSRQGAGE